MSSSLPSFNPDWEISPRMLSCLLDDSVMSSGRPGGVLLIDCRTPEERARARIDGDVFIPMDEITSRLDEIERLADDRPIVVYCHSGRRSLQVAVWLRQHADFEAVWSLAGGINAWARTIDPNVPVY